MPSEIHHVNGKRYRFRAVYRDGTVNSYPVTILEADTGAEDVFLVRAPGIGDFHTTAEFLHDYKFWEIGGRR